MYKEENVLCAIETVTHCSAACCDALGLGAQHTKDNAEEMLFMYSILGILDIFVNSM